MNRNINVENADDSSLSKIKVAISEHEIDLVNNHQYSRLVDFPIETTISLYFANGFVYDYTAFDVDTTKLSQTNWKFLENMEELPPSRKSCFQFNASNFRIASYYHSHEVLFDEMNDMAYSLLATSPMCERHEWSSVDAEIAIWDINKQWYMFEDEDSVRGHVSTDEVAKLIGEVSGFDPVSPNSEEEQIK